MRLLVDTLAALMLIAILGGVMYHNRSTAMLDERLDRTRQDVVRFQQQILLQSALTESGPGSLTHPETIDSEWFNGDLPVNSLLDADRPWVEVAPARHWDRMHPLKRTASDSTVASFWYNPHRGIVRARVPGDISDAKALQLYNEVNDCHLASLFTEW